MEVKTQLFEMSGKKKIKKSSITPPRTETKMVNFNILNPADRKEMLTPKNIR